MGNTFFHCLSGLRERVSPSVLTGVLRLFFFVPVLFYDFSLQQDGASSSCTVADGDSNPHWLEGGARGVGRTHAILELSFRSPYDLFSVFRRRRSSENSEAKRSSLYSNNGAKAARSLLFHLGPQR